MKGKKLPRDHEPTLVNKCCHKFIYILILIPNPIVFVGFSLEPDMTMYCDNQAAIHIASYQIFYEKIKHMQYYVSRLSFYTEEDTT